jgi:hypothetical protein
MATTRYIGNGSVPSTRRPTRHSARLSDTGGVARRLRPINLALSVGLIGLIAISLHDGVPDATAAATQTRALLTMRSSREYLLRAKLALKTLATQRNGAASAEMLQIAEDYLILAAQAPGAAAIRDQIEDARATLERERQGPTAAAQQA